jgi:hypothetical protein
MPTYTSSDGKPRLSSWLFLGHTTPIPSVETVATLAASVMKRGNIGEAVETALSLLEASAEGIYLLKQENEGERLPDSRHFDFIEGAKYITGQKRTDRAPKNLSAFWDKLELKPSELRKTIAHHKKNGFTGEEVEKLKAQYWRMKKNKKTI